MKDLAEIITGKNDPEEAKELVLTLKKNLNLSELDPANLEGMSFLAQLDLLIKSLHEKNRILLEENRALKIQGKQ